MGRLHSSIPFIIMGFTSMLLQITVLRLLLSTFSGNELDIGITMSFWLIYVGLGSYYGKKIRLKHAFMLSFLAIALLSQPTSLAINAIRYALSLEAGEAVSLASTIISTAIALFPLCFFIGLQFPLAVSFSDGRNAAGRVYGIEALGAFIGGILFTFVVSSRISAFELCLLLSVINIFTAVYLSKKMLISLLVVLPLIVHLSFHRAAVTLPWHGIEITQTVESRYGEIAVVKVADQSSVYTNGQLLFTYPDPQTDEIKTHIPVTLHPKPDNILVIGGSPGTLKEFLKYPVERIDFIELDPKVVDISLTLLDRKDRNVLKDQRINIIIEDGRKFIKRTKAPAYDLIVMNLPQPSTGGINRFYTSGFFEEAKAVLKEGGIIALNISQSAGYIGRRMQTVNGSIYNSLKSVFKHVEVTSQEYGGLFASDSPIAIDLESLENRFIHRAISTTHINRYTFRDVFSPFHVDYVKERLGEIRLVNTDLRPSAYLYNLMLWAEIHGGKGLYWLLDVRRSHVLPLLFLIIMISFFVFGKKRLVIYGSLFTVGFSGMSFMIIVILAYQALYGYVYEMIGTLSATFMIGLWIGTLVTRQVGNGLKMLLYLELMSFSLAIAAPIFLMAEILFYILALISGIVAGGQFSAANISIGDSTEAGKLYSIDLIGSFLGSIIPSLVVIPLFGIYSALLFIAIIKAFSALMIWSVSEK